MSLSRNWSLILSFRSHCWTSCRTLVELKQGNTPFTAKDAWDSSYEARFFCPFLRGKLCFEQLTNFLTHTLLSVDEHNVGIFSQSIQNSLNFYLFKESKTYISSILVRLNIFFTITLHLNMYVCTLHFKLRALVNVRIQLHAEMKLWC